GRLQDRVLAAAGTTEVAADVAGKQRGGQFAVGNCLVAGGIRVDHGPLAVERVAVELVGGAGQAVVGRRELLHRERNLLGLFDVAGEVGRPVVDRVVAFIVELDRTAVRLPGVTAVERVLGDQVGRI